MERFEAPKGTKDIFGKELKLKKYIERQFERLVMLHGFNLIETPIFENANLFNRGVGSSSDIVNKEMYEFKDKGDRLIALRPEFTASVVRALISNKLHTKQLPIKLAYHGPAFRYERPQAGRFRQFSQLGVEVFNKDTYLDTYEIITLVDNLLMELDLDHANEIVINSLGTEEESKKYKETLKEYFAKHIKNMCPDCQRRFETNILRVLDCKVPKDREIIEKAPKMYDFLSDEQKVNLNLMIESLRADDINVRLDPFLVRGLDYYSEIVFEIRDLKTGLALGGGGQYMNLVKDLGGPDLHGAGMSFGLDRLVNQFEMMLLENGVDITTEPNFNFAILPLINDKVTEIYAYQLASALRQLNYRVYVDAQGSNVGKKMARAEKNNVEMAIIFGDDELDNDEFTIKNLHSKEQFKVKVSDHLLDDLMHLHLNNFTSNYEDSEPGEEEQKDEA